MYFFLLLYMPHTFFPNASRFCQNIATASSQDFMYEHSAPAPRDKVHNPDQINHV